MYLYSNKVMLVFNTFLSLHYFACAVAMLRKASQGDDVSNFGDSTDDAHSQE